MKIETAVISVSDRTGLTEVGQGLARRGVRILSTGGTAAALREAGVEVTSVSDYTGFPEILDGRVKTLHPRIHAGILARHDDPAHRRVLEEQGIPPIGLVLVNLYPFSRTVQKKGVGLEEVVEQIDIGGPTLIRAAAKNFGYTAVVVDPGDYRRVLRELEERDNRLSALTRRELAAKAFQHTAAYDAAISEYFNHLAFPSEGLPPSLQLSLVRRAQLRYGENPHQRAALYGCAGSSPSGGVAAALQHQGKQLSFNNYLDLEAAWSLCGEFEEPFCAVIKHNNPCGAAVGRNPARAYEKAVACDPVSAFGSIVGFNRRVEAEAAERMSGLFVEAVLAPGYEAEALEILARKKNLRVMEMPALPPEGPASPLAFDFKKISGGFLVQDPDRLSLRPEDLNTASERAPSPEELEDLLFAWRVCKHVKSNAIVCARRGQTLGIGAGQMSRVDSVRLAVSKALQPLQGAALASDAFFPFRDGLDEAAQAGVTAIIQPGGSIKDADVIAAANEHDLAMIFTGVRHFRH